MVHLREDHISPGTSAITNHKIHLTTIGWRLFNVSSLFLIVQFKIDVTELSKSNRAVLKSGGSVSELLQNMFSIVQLLVLLWYSDHLHDSGKCRTKSGKIIIIFSSVVRYLPSALKMWVNWSCYGYIRRNSS